MKILPAFSFYTTDIVDISMLRRQQIRLGLMKAARVLFGCRQSNLRQLLTLPSIMIEMTMPGEEGSEVENTPPSPNTLLQQLMNTATLPSPIKAVFPKWELEVNVA